MGEETAARANAPSADPMVGKVLHDRFRIVERLGAGGMGTVYKAVQSPLDRIVALKVLNPNYDAKRDPGFQRRFFLEASVTSKLKHPNTITVIDYGKTDEGIFYIAMEFVEGITLAQVLQQEGFLPWNRALHVTQQVARSLREAHRTGIIHRDLKPANIMICTEETDHDLVKVLDFGLVKSFLADAPQVENAAELTQAGVFLGSPQYMAPEQAKNLADPRSDIYSLGVVVYQMLTGKPPFFSHESIDVIVKHMREPVPPMRQVKPDIDLPEQVEALVMKCLEKDPARRFQSMDELLEGIRGATLGTGVSGVFTGSRAQQTPPPIPRDSLPQSGAHRVVATPSGPQRIPPSGVHRIGQSGLHRLAQVATANSEGETISIDVSGPDAFAPPAAPARKPVIPIAIFLGSVILGLGVVFFLAQRSSPAAAAPPPPVAAQPADTAAHPATATGAPAPAPATAPANASAAGTTTASANAAPAADAPKAPVKFHVLSDPLGARVARDGIDLGETPLEFDVDPGASGTASAELTFSLDGYQMQTVTAAGTGPEVVLNQKLRRKPAAPAPKPKPKQHHAAGYKDDPYQ